MEKRSFEAVYRDHFKPLYNYIYMQLLNREQAEDIVSEAFLKAYKAYASYSPDLASEKTWLFRIAKNLLIDYYRKAGTHAEYTPGDEILGIIPYDDKELAAIEDDTNRTVYKVLSYLKPAEREIIDTLPPEGKIAFSTTNYHVFRGGLLARRVKMRAVGMGAETKWYFRPNASVREFVGLLTEHKLKQAVIFGSLMVFYASLSILYRL